jgi:hypothetical protein
MKELIHKKVYTRVRSSTNHFSPTLLYQTLKFQKKADFLQLLNPSARLEHPKTVKKKALSFAKT